MSSSSTSTAAARYPSLELSQCPFPYMAQARENEPVKRTEFDGAAEFLVTRYEDVMTVLHNPEVFSSASEAQRTASQNWNVSMIACDPPAHTGKRKIAHRSFSPRKLREYRPAIYRITDALIDSFIDEGRFEFVNDFANKISRNVTLEIMGLPESDGDDLWDWIGSFEASGIRYHGAERQALQSANGERLNDYMLDVVRERVAHPGSDAISQLICDNIAAHGEPDYTYLAAEASMLTAGGLLTAAHMMGSAMWLLLEHPDQMAAVRQDHSRIPTMLEETLRLESPAQWQPRYTTVDTDLNGTTIPAGSLVLVLFASANRDDSRFSDPDSFDIARSNVSRHVAFGHGGHVCLGAPLARAEGQAAFERLLTRTTVIRYADPDAPVRFLDSVSFRAPVKLELAFDRAPV